MNSMELDIKRVVDAIRGDILPHTTSRHFE